jgi:hypothetical protein
MPKKPYYTVQHHGRSWLSEEILKKMAEAVEAFLEQRITCNVYNPISFKLEDWRDLTELVHAMWGKLATTHGGYFVREGVSSDIEGPPDVSDFSSD